MKADYTEVWTSTSVLPLVRFADSARSILSTQLDLVGIGLEFPSALAQKLREFDEVVSWYGTNRREFRQEILVIQPRCSFLEPLPGDGSVEHAADFFLQQVGGPRGSSPRIEIDNSEARRSIVIHPFSGSASKNWPLADYQHLAAQLSRPVEWTAGPDEKLEHANRFDNLLDLAKWMRGGRCYVGNDSGISHLAAAIGLPSVILFGPTDPAVWGPRGESVQIVRTNPLEQLGISSVIEAIEQSL